MKADAAASLAIACSLLIPPASIITIGHGYKLTVPADSAVTDDGIVVGTVVGTVVNHQPAKNERMMAAKRLIEGSVFYAPQTEAGTSGALASRLAKTINTLPGVAGLGIDLTPANVTVDQFSVAAAGDATLPQGHNGTFRFTAAIGPLTATPSPGTIVASVYQPPSSSSSASSIPSGSVSSGNTGSGGASAGSSSPENTPVSSSFPEAVSLGGALNGTAPAGAFS